MDQETRDSWLQHPGTKEFRENCAETIQGIKDDWADCKFADNQEMDAMMRGKIQGLLELFNLGE